MGEAKRRKAAREAGYVEPPKPERVIDVRNGRQSLAYRAIQSALVGLWNQGPDGERAAQMVIPPKGWHQ